MSGVDTAAGEQLLTRAGGGDRAAWGELYRRYHLDVHRYVARRLSGHPHDVEDLVQETFLRVVEMADEFEPGGRGVAEWLCRRVAWCVVSDYLRRDRRAHLGAVGIAVDALRRGPAEDAETREARPVSVQVVTALARLPHGQRRAMQLRYLDGLSCEAAAAIAGLTPNTIASHCVAARRRLRAELAHLEPAGRSWLDLVPKKTALAAAFQAVGPDAHAALGWLAEHGVRVNVSYAYAEARAARAALTEAPPSTEAVDASVPPAAPTVAMTQGAAA